MRSLAQPNARVRLDGGKSITQVSFAGDAPGYRVTFQKAEADQATFEAKALKMIRAGAAGQEGNVPAGNWALRPDPNRGVLQVIRAGQIYREIPFDRQTYGLVTTYRWITNEAAQPVKIAVGTEAGTGCLFVFDLTSPETPLLRQFIGHSDRVNSVAVSDDRRYLVTGSDDCTIRYWTLEHSDAASPLMRRWGIDAVQRAGRLVVEDISDAGPLFYKGLREGDVITSIAWESSGETWSVREPNEIKRRLEQLPHSTQVVFRTSRDGLDRHAVQDQSVWKHFLAVFPTEADWIAWSPIGYYACSVGGERLIGWQISNELGEPPSHYEATQFAKTLYQPKLISTLLEAGSLKKARQLVGLQEQSAAISNPSDIRPPRVTIISPTLEPGQSFKKVTAPRIRVTAEAVSEHYPLESLRLLLNGRPYQERYSAKGITRERLSKQASWEFDLPAGRNRLQVLANVDVGEATSGSSLIQGKSDELVIEYDGEKKLPSLYVLAVGISDYPTYPGFRPLALNYARSDAEKFVATVGKYSRALFERVELIPLVDENATTEKILKAFDKIQAQVTPRDIVMVFYSGHGVLADEQFFLLSVDGRPNAITSTCVPETAIKRFCESTPGRLVLLVDACHSGAFRGEGLVRELVRDDYGVIVMASSRGDEVSLEHPDWKAGAFTKALTEGLQGMADFNRDGYVLNIEVDSYIYNRVFELTDGKQNPVSFKPTTVTPFRVSRTEQR
ncbi:MAG: caspase family protein, partial [Pirellulaceae bacterium]